MTAAVRALVALFLIGPLVGLAGVLPARAVDTLSLSGKSDSREIEIRASSFGLLGPVDSHVLVQVPSGSAFAWNGTAFSTVFDGTNVLPAGFTSFRSGAPLGSGASPSVGEIIFKSPVPADLATGPYTFYALMVTPGSSPLVSTNWLSNLAIGRVYVLNIGPSLLVMPPSGATDPTRVFIRAGQLVTDTSSQDPRCVLNLDIQNLAAGRILLAITFDAFDGNGVGVGAGTGAFMVVGGSTETYSFPFIASNSSRPLSCSEIARVAVRAALALDASD